MTVGQQDYTSLLFVKWRSATEELSEVQCQINLLCNVLVNSFQPLQSWLADLKIMLAKHH